MGGNDPGNRGEELPPRRLREHKEILSEHSSPTGRVWNENMVKEMISDALREQSDGVFVATRTVKLWVCHCDVQRLIQHHIPRLHTSENRLNEQVCRSQAHGEVCKLG